MKSKRDPTPQEAVKEARKIIPKGAINLFASSAYGTEPYCGKHIRGGLISYTHEGTHVIRGRTLRSCLAKLKKEVGK